MIGTFTLYLWAYPGSSDSEETACNVEDLGLIPGLERSPGEGNGNLLQYSCLENSIDRGADRLQSMGQQGIRHDRVTNTFTFFSVSPIFSHSVMSNCV